MMDNRIESVILVKQSIDQQNQFFHEEYTNDQKNVKIRQIPLLSSKITKNPIDDLVSPRSKPESLLVAGV